MYAIFNEPTLFQRGLATSPSMGRVSKYEEQFQGDRVLPVRLSIAVGSLESNYEESLPQFRERMESRKYTGLVMETRFVEGVGHASTVAEGYMRGFKFIFGEE